MLIFLAGKASPAWHLVPRSVPQLTPARVAAGAGRIPEPWGCSAPQLQETPSIVVGLCQWGHLAPQLAWHSCLSAQAHLRLSSPAAALVPGQQVTAATVPVSQAARAGGCSHSSAPVPPLPATATPAGHAGCWGQHQSAFTGSLHRQHRKCWRREGSTALLGKSWGTQMPRCVRWLCLLAAARPGCCPYLPGWPGW